MKKLTFSVLYVQLIHYTGSIVEGLKFWETYLKYFKIRIILRIKVEVFIDAMLTLARTVMSKMS